MSILINSLHPTFESLSAHADQGELEASRTRVGRHVTRCERCRAVVAEIRSYGKEVRSTEMPAAPHALWSRIQAGLEAAPPARTDERAGVPRAAEVDRPPRGTPGPGHDAWRASPALRPTTHVPTPTRRQMRLGGILLAAAAVVIAVLLLPMSNGDRLQASPSMGTWRFSPARPAPGSAVTVRYEPPTSMRADTALMLLATWAPATMKAWGTRGFAWAGLQDSVAVLTRQRDGAYTGRFVLPPGFTAALLRLADGHGNQPHRSVMSPDGPLNREVDPFAMLVGGTSSGAPSLASLSAALELWSGQRFEAYSVSDTLIKYFPAEPIGYAFDHHVGSRRLLDDLIAYFRRGERQYVKFDQQLGPQPVVSADHEIAMIAFADRISEPGEIARWTMRLVREHADDPRALYFYTSMLHGMLSRSGTVDSVRAALPLADTLWERNGRVLAYGELAAVAATVHDTAAYQRWALRSFTGAVQDFRGAYYGLDTRLLSQADMRAVAVPVLRERVAMPCALPSGKYALWSTPDAWRINCENGRASAYSALSYATRLEGQPEKALALADTALALAVSVHRCNSTEGHRRRGEALLAMHDTAAALPELARGIGYLNWQAERRSDSTAALLGIDRGRWNEMVQRAQDDLMACARRG